MAARPHQRTTAFVTAPIIVLAAAALAVVLGSLLVGANETNKLALQRQRETLEHALDQHGFSVARELKVQTIWNEGFERTLQGDVSWLRIFFGKYLSDLFGYDGVFVLLPDDKPVFAFVDNKAEAPDDFAQIAPQVKDLIAAVRNPAKAGPGYNVIATRAPIAGEKVIHRAVADTRKINGVPATVVVATIVPDHSPTAQGGDLQPPYPLLVAVENLEEGFLKQLGTNFEFRNLTWLNGAPGPGQSTELVKGLNGSVVGTLAWQENQPGWAFIERAASGLALALALILALTLALVRWGKRQAHQIVESEAEARKAARTDTLTGLPNRVAMNEALPVLVGRANSEGLPLGLLCIDLDHFKEINEDFGHGAGDAVLLAAARRLRTVLGSDAMLARLAGDNFMALVPARNAQATGELAADVVAALTEPIDVNDGTRVFVAASVGFANAPQDGERMDDLVRRVELALGAAKGDGGGTSRAFCEQMEDELFCRRALETALRSAVANGAIDVAYQPLMDPNGLHVVGVEALARWSDPQLGPVSPEVFVPIAEETGLIGKIGELVLQRALTDARAWPGVSVAVNVSGAQIHHGDVVPVVRDALQATGFPPQRLEIEITESVLLADERRADEQIRGLQGLGVKIALDDFGAGYSGLLYLRKFGFDKLKIDRGFIKEAGSAGHDHVILGSIIELGHALEMTVTAEGVETPAQQQWLAGAGCHQLQGYLFSHPLSARDLTAFIARHQPSAAAS